MEMQNDVLTEKIPVYEIYQGEIKVGVFFNEELAAEVNNFLNKKKKIKPKIEIPQDKLEEFNQLWPEFKLPTGKYGRCSMMELNSCFQFFFKTFPNHTDWWIILQAAKIYLAEREQDKWEYTRRAKYFIRREAKDKSWESELSEYYERVRDGVQELPQEQKSFEPKVY